MQRRSLSECFPQRESLSEPESPDIISYQDAHHYKYKLRQGEFFSFAGNEDSGHLKMVMLNHPESDIGTNDLYHRQHYDDFKQKYKEVSLAELQAR